MEKNKKSMPIPFRIWPDNHAYVKRLQEAREYKTRNFTLNRIIQNHMLAFEKHRLMAKAEAKALKDKAKKIMLDYDLTDKDMEDVECTTKN